MAITDEKKDLLLGQSDDELIANADDNFNSLFDTVDDLDDAINNSGFITKDVDNLTNYTVKGETGTEVELSIDNTTYVMTLKLKNSAGAVVSTATIDFPIESVVVDASYADGTLTLELKNGTTVDVDISAIVSGLVPNTRTVNGKALSSNITLTQDNIDDGTDYKRFSSSDKAKLDKFSVDGNGNLTYDGNEIGKVKGVALNGTEIELDENGIANIDISDISVDVEALEAKYIPVTPQAVTLNDKAYKAIVVKETDVSLEVLNSKGKAVVTQVIRANGNIYYCLPSTDTNTYTLRKVGGNAVGGGGSGLSSVTLYRHTIYAKTSQAVTNFNDYSNGNPTHIYLCLQTLTNGSASYTSLDTATNMYKDSYGNSNYMLPFTGYCVFATNDKEYYCPLIHAYYELGKLNLKFVNSFDGTVLTYKDTDKVIGIIEDRVSIIVNQ